MHTRLIHIRSTQSMHGATRTTRTVCSSLSVCSLGSGATLITSAVGVAVCLQALDARPQSQCCGQLGAWPPMHLHGNHSSVCHLPHVTPHGTQLPLAVCVQVAPDLSEDEVVQENGSAEVREEVLWSRLGRVGCCVCLGRLAARPHVDGWKLKLCWHWPEG
jgi:hypothetical protein